MIAAKRVIGFGPADRSTAPEVVLRFAVPVVVAAGLPLPVRSARVVAIIPARYRSTRLPGKPLALIDGKTMVEHVSSRAALARSVEAVIVATDDLRIAEAVDGFGGTAVMTSASHATGTDRLAEVAASLDAEILVNVLGDEPLITPDAIDAAIAPLLSQPDDVVSTLRRRIDDPDDLHTPSVVKVVVDAAGYALYFTRAPIPFVRPGHQAPAAWRHMGLYVYRRDFLIKLATLPQTPLEQAEGLEQLRILEHGYRIRTVETTVDSIGVDTPEDLARVRRLVEAGAKH
jgi:3-deoxy-manno-octulosonate cytidylyltransferase (CMP-KDO synthetase)